MLDIISTAKGWSIEYTLFCTYRQIACLWERYWDKQVWDFKQQARLNPFYKEKPQSELEKSLGGNQKYVEGTQDFDLSGDDAEATLHQLGIPVKHRKPTK